MNKQFVMPEQFDTISQKSISILSVDSLQHNLQKGELFTNRPLDIATNLNAMKSHRDQSTPSPNIIDINDSTFIGDINELNHDDKKQMKIYVKDLKFKSKIKGIVKVR
jgi:hypothetical protein